MQPRSRRQRDAAQGAYGRDEEAPVLSSLKADLPEARRRYEASQRSTQLTQLFDRLSSADERLRANAQLADDFAGGGLRDDAADLLSPGATASRAPPAAGGAAAPAPGAPLLSGVFLRSGRPVVLSAGSRRLPPIFREQVRTVRSVEATVSSMQQTLQHLHRDLAFTARGRAAAPAPAATTRAHAPPPQSDSDTESPTAAVEATAAEQRRLSAAADARNEAARIQRARAAAADEGASDDQSVDDYGVDCEVPPLTSESRLVDEVAAMAVSIAKMRESCASMAETEAAAPSTSPVPWFSSALRMRDMKAAAARLDYHAHTALSWSHRAREQLLLQAAMLNTVSSETRTQLLHQQHHWQEFQTRLRDAQQAATQLQADVTLYQARAQAELARRTALQEELRRSAQSRGLVNAQERNPLKAELALLLEEREWPSRTLRRDAEVVMEWLRSPASTLE